MTRGHSRIDDRAALNGILFMLKTGLPWEYLPLDHELGCGIASRERLGKWRWVVERTLGRLHRFRRLRIRYERLADTHQAFLSLACILICWRYIEIGRFC